MNEVDPPGSFAILEAGDYCLPFRGPRVSEMLNVILAAILVICPAVCGATEVGHDAHEHSTPEAPESPTHCPSGGEECICGGAVETGAVRVPALKTEAPLPLTLSAPVLNTPPPAHHLTRDGTPTGLAGWGSTSTIRALLQVYRF